ncbi:hypothetical protein JCM21900_003206 [Sporobolomyces salmonicolor]
MATMRDSCSDDPKASPRTDREFRLADPPSPSPRQHSHAPLLWIAVGFVGACALGAVLAILADWRADRRLGSETKRLGGSWQWVLSNDGGGGRALRVGPRPTKLGAVGERVPGAKELLSSRAPATSLYDALRPDLRYVTADSWSGEVGQFLSVLSLIYLAQESQRIAIIPSVWRDGEHYGSSKVRMSDLFDMERFRADTGTLFVEWSDVKPFDSAPSRMKTDEVGCYFANNGFAGGASFGDYLVTPSTWRLPPSSPSWFSSSLESLLLIDYDLPLRLAQTRQLALESNRTLPRNFQEGSQLMCYTNVWALGRLGGSAPSGWWEGDYKAFEGLQRVEGGMRDLLHPSLRGTHPEWWAVGRYIDFTRAIWNVALLAVRKTLGTADLPASMLTVHIRHGDFEHWCPSGHGCVAPLEAYNSAVDELLKNLPLDTIVLVTTDETSPTFHASLAALGWCAISHTSLGTAALLQSKYGDASGWYDSAVDQAILSLGRAFVGTLDSQVSLVSALRVASWNDGETRLVRRQT